MLNSYSFTYTDLFTHLSAIGKYHKTMKGDRKLSLDKFNYDELITSGPFERNWRGIIIALLVIAAMCSLIILATLLITPCKNPIIYA
ncbi:hypothetical protein X798_00097 [Onchocerca flexuosa]|uniref:Uncharacterized protein n=1 Tax=Onchocerca flexuosa TaxID=387005 RepID=A0A238C5G9_9BILA|nr:hypothetical protein X798_00097 [Onchocerca flexuosa]